MKKALATLVIASLGVLGVAGPATVAAQPVASASCVNASTPGGVKCLEKGQFCSHKAGYAVAYRRAGFRCKANGHLTYR
jgi:Flp pilus assembly protein TadD